jgi:hypothetical protein
MEQTSCLEAGCDFNAPRIDFSFALNKSLDSSSYGNRVLCAWVICLAGYVLSRSSVTFILCPLLQVDPRILKAVAIEHHNDADSAVVAILDEIMPSSVGISSVNQESTAFNDDLVRNLSSHSVRETGSSSSAGKYRY